MSGIGLALSCITILTPTGNATICTQLSGSDSKFEAIAGKLAPIGTEQYMCAIPKDLADRLGIEFCDRKF